MTNITRKCRGQTKNGEKEMIKANGVHKIHIIPHSHIDTEWYWTYGETKKRAVAIIEAALSCMRKRKDFTFAQDQVTAMEPVLHYLDKEDRECLRDMIKQKRFEIVGGMWVQPEVQVPHGEVLIRNILTGRKWFQGNLGVSVETAWNIDTFGQCLQLPQILRLSKFKYFVFWRGVPERIAQDLPNIFYWQSPDGSKILTHWMSEGYGSPIASLASESFQLKKELFYNYRTFPKRIETNLEKAIEEVKECVDRTLEKSPQGIVLLPLGGDNFILQKDVFEALGER